MNRPSYDSVYADHDLRVLAATEGGEQTAASQEGGKDDGWMPMLTAPLDGTEINLMIRHADFWTALKVNGRDTAESKYQAVCKGKWIDHNGGGWTWRGLAGNPVGWQPPLAAAAKERK